MQDPNSQSDVNPGRVEQALDETPVEREGVQGAGVERQGTQGGDMGRGDLPGVSIEERVLPGAGQGTQREALGASGNTGREGGLDTGPSGGVENAPAERGSAPGEELH